MVKKPLFLLIAGIYALQLSAQSSQTNALGTWNVLHVRYLINDKWNVFFEPQLRSLRFYDDFHYHEVKGGANYRIDKNFSIGFGIGKYDTYQEGGSFVTPKQNDELRTWLHLTMQQQLQRFRFEHRYRAEQRFANGNYRNRFRYRVQVSAPLNRAQTGVGALSAIAWNEIFFTNKEPYFERNRVFAGMGYEFSRQLSLQMGWLYQFDYRLTDEIGRNFLQITLQTTL